MGDFITLLRTARSFLLVDYLCLEFSISSVWTIVYVVAETSESKTADKVGLLSSGSLGVMEVSFLHVGMPALFTCLHPLHLYSRPEWEWSQEAPEVWDTGWGTEPSPLGRLE